MSRPYIYTANYENLNARPEYNRERKCYVNECIVYEFLHATRLLGLIK